MLHQLETISISKYNKLSNVDNNLLLQGTNIQKFSLHPPKLSYNAEINAIW